MRVGVGWLKICVRMFGGNVCGGGSVYKITIVVIVIAIVVVNVIDWDWRCCTLITSLTIIRLMLVTIKLICLSLPSVIAIVIPSFLLSSSHKVIIIITIVVVIVVVDII